MLRTLDQNDERQTPAAMFQPASDRCSSKKLASKPLDQFRFPSGQGCDKPLLSNPFMPPDLCAPGTKNGLTMLVDFMDFLAKDPKAAEAFLDLASNLLDEFGEGADKPICSKPPMFAVK